MSQRSIADAFRLWEAEKALHVKPSSMAAYSLTVRTHIRPFFEKRGEISSQTVREFVGCLDRSGMSGSTIRGILTVTKMILEFIAKEGLMDILPVKIASPSRKLSRLPQVMPIEEERQLIRYLDSNPNPMNMGLMLCVLAGMRIGEVCGLKWKDIDLFNHAIHIVRTVYRIYLPYEKMNKTRLVVGSPKTLDSAREVPIPSGLVDKLIRIRMGKGEELFFTSCSDKPTDPQTIRRLLYKATTMLGLHSIRVHSLRHTFATRCMESKCDVKTLSALLGHSDVSTTLNLYVHPGLEQKRSCVEEMMGLL
ncbi:MAG: site-specific integrase [Bacteroidales bacterium]|nr:site-specific integrase [Bacteroidales bacterium]MBQ6577857.1 site-specific integrase [Bacteroidales bacterium]